MLEFLPKMVGFSGKNQTNQPTSRQFAEESGGQDLLPPWLVALLLWAQVSLSVSKGIRCMTSGAPAEVTFWDTDFPLKPRCAREDASPSAVGDSVMS